jgi:hypothetical protein
MDEIFGPEITWEKPRTHEDTGSPFIETRTHVNPYVRNAEIWLPRTCRPVPLILSPWGLLGRDAGVPGWYLGGQRSP